MDKSKPTLEQRARLLVASAAEMQLTAALDFLKRAQANIVAIHFAPDVLENVTSAKLECEIALNKLTLVIRRLP